jgi:hypothetical protein
LSWCFWCKTMITSPGSTSGCKGEQAFHQILRSQLHATWRRLACQVQYVFYVIVNLTCILLDSFRICTKAKQCD